MRTTDIRYRAAVGLERVVQRLADGARNPDDGGEFAFSAIRKVLVENGHAEAQLDIDSEVMAHIFGALASYVADAPNYRTADVMFRRKGTTEREALVITVQKKSGKSPHELRVEAEAERDRLRAVIEDLADNPDAAEIASMHASAWRRETRP